MTLLDRFRTPPPQRHPDAAVRLAYIAELPLDDRQTIAAMAREDDDARVRKAAVAKLMDPAALAAIAREDEDEGIRGQAAAMLRDIAVEAFEDVGETESLEAVEAIADPRALAQVAKAAAREITALRALSRVDDARLLGSIARHAVVEGVRRGAFESLRARGERAEILAIAMNGDFKDTAIAAAETIEDHEQLEQIASRGKNKSAAKRARAILREAQPSTPLEASLSAPLGSADVAVEPAVPDPIERTATPPHGGPVASQSEVAVPLEEPATTAEHVDAKAHAAAVTAPPREADRTLAEAAAERDRAQAADLERRRARLAELADEAAAASGEADLALARKRFALVRREWHDLSAGIDIDAAVAARFAEHDTLLASREAAAREADARARRDALARMHNLLGRVEPLAEKTDLSLKAADRALRDVRTALGSMPMLPAKQDYEDVVRRLKAAQATLTPKVQELREADEWRRFANVAIQEQLCARMEALQALEDPEAIAREVHQLQQQWRAAADVPRAQADALWRRFKTAHDAVWPHVEAHFAAQAQARAENLARKVGLCERAEALTDSTSWIQTADEIKHLQAEWKAIGPVSRGREKAVWDRFRTACDRFFRRRHDDLAQRKIVWAENLAKKEALCVRAETLAQSTDWDAAAGEIKRMQAEWKTVGPVKKTKSEAIWHRFRSACDAFFARYAQRHETARTERVAAREAICAEIEGLAPSPPESISASAAHTPGESVSASAPQAPDDLLARVRGIRSRWQQEIAARGVDPDRARALDERYNAALARVMTRWPAAFAGSDLDPEANRKRMESLVKRMEDLATSLGGPAADAAADTPLSPTTRLAAMLKEALAANTIGGNVDDDSRMRAAVEEVRQAQLQWSRIGVVRDETRRHLADRFQNAIRRITDRTARSAGSRGNTRRGSSPA